jgi:uncharacterized membrane protein YfcA
MMVSFTIGFCAGIFGGLVGLGGGVIIIPLLVGFLELDQYRAHGTSLVAVVCTGIAGAVVYALKDNVDVMASILLAATAVMTARMGARFAHTLAEWKLKRSFGWFLLIMSGLLLAKPYLPHVHGMETGWPCVLVLLVSGVFTGFLSGMMGVGGGSLVVPAMVLLAGFTQHIAQGSSLLAMVPAGGMGAYTHWKLGNVRTDILKGIIPGVFIGTILGSYLANVLPAVILQILFAVVLTWTGLRYLRAQRPPDTADTGTD